MIHPTLNSPDVILEETDPKEGSERDSKYLFIKTFVKSDGTRIVHFESVTVMKDGMEVSISSHEIKGKSLKNKMQNDIVLHLDEKLSPSSEMRLTEAPSESEEPDLVPTSDNIFSERKVNTLSSKKQVEEGKSSKDSKSDLERGGAGGVSDMDVAAAEDPWGGDFGGRFVSKREARRWAADVRSRMRERVENISGRLGLRNVRIVENAEGLTGRRAQAKGWFDPRSGEIVIVLGNHESVADAEATLLHEAVAHYGLRKLCARDFAGDFNEFLDTIYRQATKEVRMRIAELSKKHGWDLRVATEEYLASLAESGEAVLSSGGHGWLGKIKQAFIRLLSKFGMDGIRLAKMSDNELMYLLRCSYDNLKGEYSRPYDMLTDAQHRALEEKMGVARRRVDQNVKCSEILTPLWSMSGALRYVSLQT